MSAQNSPFRSLIALVENHAREFGMSEEDAMNEACFVLGMEGARLREIRMEREAREAVEERQKGRAA